MDSGVKLVYSFSCLDVQPDALVDGQYSALGINFAFTGARVGGPIKSSFFVVNGWQGPPLTEFSQHILLRGPGPDGAVVCSTKPAVTRLSRFGNGVCYDQLIFEVPSPGDYDAIVYLNDAPVGRYTVNIDE